MLRKSLSVAALALFNVLFIGCNQPVEKEFDTRVIEQLDALSEKIGNLNSFSYTLDVEKSELQQDSTWVSEFFEYDVYIEGPNKLYVYSESNEFLKGYWFDGSRLTYYSYSENAYDTISVKGNVIEAIDFVHENFGIDFPAADFLYPSLTDDIMTNYDNGYFVREEEIADNRCSLIEISNANQFISVWVEVESNLPIRFEIYSDGNKKRYAANFSNWRQDPRLSKRIFNFSPPSDAEKIDLKPIK